MNEIGLHQFSSVSNPTQSSDSNVNMNIISVMSDKGNKHINNKHDIDDTENDDVNSPFKTNHNDLVTLSPSETEIKTINRRSHGKSLFRSIFCCFSSSLHRNHAKSSSQPSKLKNSSLNSTNFNIACNTNLNNNIANDENSISVNNNNNTTINNETTDNNQVGLNLSITNGTINSINNNNLNNNTNNITNNLSSKITNTNVNTDNSNGFQSNYNFSPSYPSYKENYHQERFLLPQINTIDTGKKCLIIDLDETLVHSSFKQVTNADFIVPVEIDGLIHQVYVLKRPFVDEFLKKMGQIYECVLFTASLAKYADPVADLLDKWGVFRYRLFREACVYYRGNYVKDLSRLGRDLNKVIILDNSPASYIFHPNNAVPCISWFDDMSDTELIDLVPHFERLASVDSVYSILKQSNTNSISNILNNQSDSILHQQTTNYVHSQVNYDENLNQQVPIQTQSVIYQIQNTNTVKNNSNCSKNEDKNDTTTNNNNFNYLLDENKILLSIDLMMTTKQQQLQKNQINQDNIRIREEKKINKMTVSRR